MECEKIKELIPRYFNHTASEEEIKKVEEHLCLCHDCRTLLGELMDKEAGDKEQPSGESQSEQMQMFSYDDIAGIPPDEPVKEDVQPDKGPAKPQPSDESPSEPETKEGMEYFPAKDFEEILKKPPEPIEDVSAEEADTTPEPEVDKEALAKPSESQPESKSSFEPIQDQEPSLPDESPQEEQEAGKQEEVIQTPLGPMRMSSDDEASEENVQPSEPQPPSEPSEPEEPAEQSDKPDKKEKVIQTPLGPISISSDNEESSLNPVIGEESKEKKEQGPAETPLEAAGSESKHLEEEIQVKPLEPIAAEQEIQGIGAKDFSFRNEAKFELDSSPIPPDKTDTFGYAMVAIAVVALLFVVYLFLHMKG